MEITDLATPLILQQQTSLIYAIKISVREILPFSPEEVTVYT